MIELVPLCTATYQMGEGLLVGPGPAGERTVGQIASARFTGERLNASLAGPAAADWLARNGAIGMIDVRLTLRTDDGALIYMIYGGRITLGGGGPPTAFVAPTFETSDPRYTWLNSIQAVGKAQFIVDDQGARLEYEFHEIR